MFSATVCSWSKEVMKITHSYHKHVDEFLKSSVHAKKCHLELEIVFTSHKLKITVTGLPEIHIYLHTLQTEKHKPFSFPHYNLC